MRRVQHRREKMRAPRQPGQAAQLVCYLYRVARVQGAVRGRSGVEVGGKARVCQPQETCRGEGDRAVGIAWVEAEFGGFLPLGGPGSKGVSDALYTID